MNKKPVYIDHVGWYGDTPLFVLRYCESRIAVAGCKAGTLQTIAQLAKKIKNPVAYSNHAHIFRESGLRHELILRKLQRSI
jgi:hypothetical protein